MRGPPLVVIPARGPCPGVEKRYLNGLIIRPRWFDSNPRNWTATAGLNAPAVR